MGDPLLAAAVELRLPMSSPLATGETGFRLFYDSTTKGERRRAPRRRWPRPASGLGSPASRARPGNAPPGCWPATGGPPPSAAGARPARPYGAADLAARRNPDDEAVDQVPAASATIRACGLAHHDGGHRGPGAHPRLPIRPGGSVERPCRAADEERAVDEGMWRRLCRPWCAPPDHLFPSTTSC